MSPLAGQSGGAPPAPLVAYRFIVRGRVQGVGFRPAVARWAIELGLAGQVANTRQGVEIIVEGAPERVSNFERELLARLPPLARVESLCRVEFAARGLAGFQIGAESAGARASVPIPLDLAACGECLAEVADPADRRHGYALASCTNCGPRYSILHSLPYERAATTMARFSFCSACAREYRDPADRRFHAETLACAECGPGVWLADQTGRRLSEGDATIDRARAALAAGQIVALKGLGGYQLLVDAGNSAAVRRLRERKGRAARPLAVLVESLSAAEQLANLSGAERELLACPAGPIVVAKRKGGAPLAAEIAPGLADVGLMLPTTPLHMLLSHGTPPLVATSGNREGDPLAHDEREAHHALGGIADLFLHHDRPVDRPIDDSVQRVIAGRAATLRLARGLAPLSLQLEVLSKRIADLSILAVGGHQKCALSIFNGEQSILGPHLGDLDGLVSRERFGRHAREFCQLLDAAPELIVHDLHPDYFTTQWSAGQGVAALGVQHHHAHVVAAQIEAGWLDRPVLGVAWDGAGYGPDGTIWGGEFLRATAEDFRRVGRLRPFALPGGEAAVRQPWRVALALLSEALGIEEAVGFLRERGYREPSLLPLANLHSNTRLLLCTSSAGRLFDGVAAMILPLEVTLGGVAQFEGQLAILLEAACNAECSGDDEHDPEDAYELSLLPGDPAELDWRPLVRSLVADLRAGVAVSEIARRFHAALAEGIVQIVQSFPGLPIVLCGGVFQNRVLTEQLARRMADLKRPLGLPGVIPPGDGGLSAGQLAIALARLVGGR